MKTTQIVEYGTYHPNHPDHITWHESEYAAREYARSVSHRLAIHIKTTRPNLGNTAEEIITLEREDHPTIKGQVIYAAMPPEPEPTTPPEPAPEPPAHQKPLDRIIVSYMDGTDVYTGHNLNATISPYDETLEITENETRTLAEYAPGTWRRWRRTEQEQDTNNG